jgi:Domain of unknown function (DUF5916)/Carbohydrate family 9 binding domain-like
MTLARLFPRPPLALFALCLSFAATAADLPAPQPMAVPRLDTAAAGEALVVDGRIDEAAWADAAAIELAYETTPGDNTAPAARTVARMLYTEDALWLSFRAEDPDPAAIRAFLRDRDALWSDDFVGIELDTFDDQRRAYGFYVNPLGVQADLISEEATGNEDTSWDGLWTSAARITERGYEAEIRIPFTTLRFRPGDGVKRWGARFLRIRPRDFRYTYASSRIERGARCNLCALDKVEGFAGVRQGRNLEIAPTLTVRHAQTRVPGGGWQRGDTGIEPGLDATWAPTPNLTLNATLNPDFSQVESDQAQLDLNSSFALFFEEKRPFFLEGADYFNSPLNVVYTRQIADPDVGLRVTGRNGRQAYGAVVARDTVTQILLPGPLGSGFRTLDQDADVAIGRYRYDFAPGADNRQASLGGIATWREGEGYRNALAGIDGRLQQGAHTFTGQWLRSETLYPTELAQADAAPEGEALVLRYNYGNRNWNANLSHTDIDEGFRADLGFIGQVGYRKSVIGGSRTWYGKEGAKITRISLYSDWDITHRFDGRLLERELEANLSLRGPRQSEASLSGLARVRFWNGTLFDERWLALYGELTLRPGLETGLYLRRGTQLDLAAWRTGTVEQWEPWLSLDVGRGINLNLSYSAQRLHRDGGTAFRTGVLDGRFSWQLDPRQRLRLSLQGSVVERDPALYPRAVQRKGRDVAAQLLYSYKLNPRSALYAGYSHGGYSDDDQTALTDGSRSLFLKLSYAWQP